MSSSPEVSPRRPASRTDAERRDEEEAGARRRPIVWDKSNERQQDPEQLLTRERLETKERPERRERSSRDEGRHRETDRSNGSRHRRHDRRGSPESRERGGRREREREDSRNRDHRDRRSRDDRRHDERHDGRFERSRNRREDQGREWDRGKEPELPVARGRGSLKGRPAARELDGDARPNGSVRDEPAAEAVAPAGDGQPEAAKPTARASKAGGAYIPPFRLAQMMQEATSKTDPAYQRLTWDALRKSINGLVNKANAQNIRPIIKELLTENLHRGRGLFCLSVMKSQVASPSYTPVFSALVAVMATRLPEVATLLVHRLVAQFKRAFKRNDRALTSSVVTFLCHLANQQVVPVLLVAQTLLILLEAKTDDSVELAATALKESGALLQDSEPQMLRMVMDEMRQVLQEGQVDQRVQYIVEGLFKIQRDGFEKSGFPQIPEGLDLLEDADKITVNFDIASDVPEVQQGLNIFKADPLFEEHEKEYEAEAKKWFDDESDSEDGDSDEDDSSEEEAEAQDAPPAQEGMKIQDQTDTNLINLRRTIYLTIMSSMDFEEAGHKLMKIELRPGQEMEIVTMIIECCSQEKTYLRYYGLLAQRYCGHNQTWQALFEDCFRKQYMFVHRLETNKLRNVGRFFAHLLATDSVSWGVLDCIRITEEDTTSSSRIFIKILFQDLAENMGLESLNARLQDPECLPWFIGIFPKDTPRNVRFSINFFTSIGLGGVTQKMREYLKELPKILAAQKAAAEAAESSDSSDSDSDSDSSDSSDSDSSSSSDSDSDSSDSSDSSSDDTSSSGTEITDPPSRNRHVKDRPAKSPKLEPSRNRQDESRKEPSSKRARVADVEIPSKRQRGSDRQERSGRSRR